MSRGHIRTLLALAIVAIVGSLIAAMPTAHGANLPLVDVGQHTAGSVAVIAGRPCSMFDAAVLRSTDRHARIGSSGQPIAPDTAPQPFTGSFIREAVFHGGGPRVTAETTVTGCHDHIVLSDPQQTPQPSSSPGISSGVRANQVGYLPGAVKQATVIADATSALDWELRDSSGSAVARGTTVIFGHDAASGDHVHIADFSAYRTPGRGFTLSVGSDVSRPFDIAADVYRQMKYDALAYFYHNRSGIPIEAQYVGAAYARPAGHASVDPNQGDRDVTCAPDVACEYRLDVRGGWYDAGDHGKYVVNGGISLWTLLNQYERAQHLGTSGGAFGDGSLRIPERGNGVSDLLDEARWEMEFLLRMQVPDGQPLAGMAHHKVHDASWTGLPLRPDQDPQRRYLRPPSTAATLNLAATAAQCARIWQAIDPAFAATCLRAAERAWSAAVANPAIFAPDSDGNGGGAYSDGNVTDEFYWAAAELYVTTQRDEYRRFVAQSPHYLQVPAGAADGGSSMSWGSTQALGTITLATVPSDLPDGVVQAARRNIVRAANLFVQTLNEQGYRVPFAPDATGSYPWGSNSSVLNNLIVIGLAWDFTHEPRYLNAVVNGMGYILGRNPMDISYVSGYGTHTLSNPHHRFWAHQLDPQYPSVPPGVVSGGPNSGLQDPYAQSIGLKGCPPQKCYVDHIESWSTNEVTINWNAPLAWVVAFLDEQAR